MPECYGLSLSLGDLQSESGSTALAERYFQFGQDGLEAGQELLRRRSDVDFATTSALMHVAQAPATVDRLTQAVAELGPFRLAALSPLVTIGRSLIAALAVLERSVTADAAWLAVSLDDRWQLERWGSDPEAEQALDNRRRDFFAAASFDILLDR